MSKIYHKEPPKKGKRALPPPRPTVDKTTKVTRVEIIKNGKGRMFVDMDCEIDDIQLQDNNKTMKIFLKNKGK